MTRQSTESTIITTLPRIRGSRYGIPNKMSRRAREEAAKHGLLPHEWLLEVMRGHLMTHKAIDQDGKLIEVVVVPTFEERCDAARAAAPFYAPKLVSQHVKLDGAMGYHTLSDKELDERIREKSSVLDAAIKAVVTPKRKRRA